MLPALHFQPVDGGRAPKPVGVLPLDRRRFSYRAKSGAQRYHSNAWVASTSTLTDRLLEGWPSSKVSGVIHAGSVQAEQPARCPGPTSVEAALSGSAVPLAFSPMLALSGGS